MIAVKLIGGLGNQMFQYAAGRALAQYYQVPLKLDKSFLEKDSGGAYTQRNFELDIFHIEAEFLTTEERRLFLKHAESKLYRELYRRFPSLFTKKFIAENSTAYMPRFKSGGPDAYLEGFWQSEKYFSDIKDVIRSDFRFKNPIDRINDSLVNRMSDGDSISLHVRRADYVNDKTTNDTHGTCTKEYYAEALSLLTRQTDHPELFVFSDDVSWCRENFAFDIPVTYIDHNRGKQSFEDMRLMSHCRHNIIANSSFSWWGAWLNTDPEKKIIAPKNWFKQRPAPDIYPQGWIVI